MSAAAALMSIAISATLGTLAVWMLTRLVRTIRELRSITTGLNDVMRWTVGQIAADPPGRADGPAAGAPTLG